MVKKLLILCDTFAPPAFLPRIVNLCKNIDKTQWQITLFTEKTPGVDFQSDICPIYQMPFFKTDRLIQNIQWLTQFFFEYEDKQLVKYIEKTTEIKSYDLIFCSSFNLFPLTAARLIAQKYNKPLVVDLRDIAEQWGTKSYFKRTIINKKISEYIQSYIEKTRIKRRNKTIKKAKEVITISPWHKNFLSKLNPDTHLIYNGFDSSSFYHKRIKSDYFEITYTGRIYDFNFRNPHLLFQAIKELDNEKIISPADIRIIWHIDAASQPELRNIVTLYGIEAYNEINGYVPTDRIADIINRASINLLLTNKTTEKGPFGIMTTKFFEALGVEKPVLCVRSDEGCLADVIKETGAGLAATTVEQVKEFIIEKYEEWKSNGFTHVNVKNKEKFSRQYQAKQFMEIFEQSIDNEWQ